MPLANFLVALGIPQVGRKTGKMLAKYVGGKIEGRRQKEEGSKEDEEKNNSSSRNFSGNALLETVDASSEKYPGSTIYKEPEEKKVEDSGSESGMTDIL